jgi:hypothetical protein
MSFSNDKIESVAPSIGMDLKMYSEEPCIVKIGLSRMEGASNPTVIFLANPVYGERIAIPPQELGRVIEALQKIQKDLSS